MSRQCTRTCCTASATARLRYHYEVSTVWLDDVDPAERAPFELCTDHADALSVPRGWELDDRRSRTQPLFSPADRLAG